ncbi:MAG: UDP-N-acetylmuramoyl-L-alanyl-D-glutamate--2,6-diaminopimelate ligase [Gemmatimonadota bacterium]|jgi:UDP-N-acetylmuramoyl-L-alanyl-D-glutamate--2,6-diaminopimelate ligase|nr:UDP-N-acetylmuramoyl-L-alanyl-D-glutamate--2,6-diaminopimelate ligase [Gemmatimonadota bacterium]
MSVPLLRIAGRLRQEGLLVREIAGSAGIRDVSVHAITSDSRTVPAGSLFCAVRGAVVDGHSYLPAVAEAGAAAALVEKPVEGISIPQIVVTKSRAAVAFAAAEFFSDPWKEMTLVGVTGTNGKTTTASILRHLLGTKGPAASIGTLGLIGADGQLVPGSEGLTTPGPIQFARELRGLADEGVRSVAMEVSSHALEQGRVAAAVFSAAIFTNLTRDHLDYHGDLESYRAAKLGLVDLVRSGGVIAVNADDPAWAEVTRADAHVIRFGTQGEGEVLAEDIEMSGDGVSWKLWTPSCTSPVTMPVVGLYNVYNALGAATALWGLGWTANEIAEALATLGQVPGRMERVPVPGGPRIVIDFAHTPDALERAISALRPMVEGRLIVVFGAGGDRDRGKRPEMGRVVAELADLAIVTSDNPRHEDPDAIADDIEAGMGAGPRERIINRKEAIARAIALATPEDAILVAGKGHETYQIRGDESFPFDERKIIAEILAERTNGETATGGDS